MPGRTELGPEIPWEIVGVIADEKVGGLDDKPENNPGMYVTNEQSPVYSQAVLVQSAGDTALLREPIRRAIHELSRDQVLPEDVQAIVPAVVGHRLHPADAYLEQSSSALLEKLLRSVGVPA